MVKQRISLTKGHRMSYEPRAVHNTLNKYRFLGTSTGVMAFIGMGICMIEHELYLRDANDSSNLRVALLTGNLGVNIILAIQITMMYLVWIDYNTKTGTYLLGTNLLSSKVVYSYSTELILNMITPYPWFYKTEYPNHNRSTTMWIYLNTLFLTFMMFYRTYHLIRIILNQSDFMTSRAERLTRIFGQSYSYSFAIKGEFSQNSILFVLVSYGYGGALTGFLLRSSEHQIQKYFEVEKEFSYTNSAWICFITMTSVGYGEISPVSETGKITTVAGAFMGVALQALIIISFLKNFEFSSIEKISYMLINTVNLKQKLKIVTGDTISTVYRWK